MDDALGVRGDESGERLPRNRQRARQRNASFFSENGREILAFDVRHRDVLDAVDLSEVVNSDDVLVRDLPREEQLALESPLQILGGRLVVGNLRPNHLQRDRDAKLGVPCLVDGAHAAEAKQSRDAVAGPEVRADGKRPGRTVARRAGAGLSPRGVTTQASGIGVRTRGTAHDASGVGVRARGAAPELGGIGVRRAAPPPRRVASASERGAPPPRRVATASGRGAPPPRRVASASGRGAPPPRRVTSASGRVALPPRRVASASGRVALPPRRVASASGRVAPPPRRVTSGASTVGGKSCVASWLTDGAPTRVA